MEEIQGIKEFIPQREPIIMVDEILECKAEWVDTKFLIKEDNLFIEDGELTESGLMENMAQSAASKVGYECKLNNEPVPLGFIGAISKVNMIFRPKVNDILITKVIFDKTVFNVSLIKAIVSVNEKVACECQMKIVVENKEEN